MSDNQLTLRNLRSEYLINPLGLDVSLPRFSWEVESDRRGAGQTAYQVVCLAGAETLWDSGKVVSSRSAHIPYAGSKLQPRQQVQWKIRIWDEQEQASEWSAPARFEMGLTDPGEWKAKWIGHPLVGGTRTSSPCPFFRRGFVVDKKIHRARLYVTALGVYEATLNGQRIGEDVFSPGWTDYNKRVRYQTYDVTPLLAPGENTLGAVLGDGWYCGRIAWLGRQQYGERPKLLAQLEITYSDGARQTIVSDESWQTSVGPILESDMLMGEAYDARLEPDHWAGAILCDGPGGLALAAQNTPTVRVQGELSPVSDPAIVWGWPEHDWIFDFGQNMVGRVRLKVKGARGTTLTLRFGEVLDSNGRLYTANLRTARQTDYYTLKGDPHGEAWESRFTFHGFRYVQVNGLSEPPSRDLLTAVVLHSDSPAALVFECSDPLLNQLHHNIQWGWKGNSVDIPTDCPQRDERLGWTGDAQVFARTATYLTDSAGFFTKWIQDMSDSQLPHGAIPAVAPVIATLNKSDGGAAWSDAFIIVPWTLWQQYGDVGVLETHYPAMRRYMDYLVSRSKDLIRLLPDERELPKAQQEWQLGGYGDWLAQDGSPDNRGFTPRDLIGTAFLAYDAHLMSQIAEALGKHDDARDYSKLFDDTRAAFIKRFITADGLLIGPQQTGYILALYFNLVPEHLRSKFIDALIEDIESRRMHMSTGFVGTPYICQVLTDAGRLDLAFALLMQKTFPSWLYPVLHGATTLWERWDGWTESKGFQDPEMNSFNHYAYGAVGTWMYQNIAGIQAGRPGFKRIVLKPRPGGGLTYAHGEYRSIYGTITSTWRMDGSSLDWRVAVPPNTSAEAHIPCGTGSPITESSVPLDQAPGVKVVRKTAEAVVVELQSGKYRFEAKG